MQLQEIFKIMKEDKAVRRTIVRRSAKFFFHYYFGHYVEFPIAPFHEELFELMQNDNHSMLVISAFRGSGKSTLLTMSNVIWSIINGRAKYILIISETQPKAQAFLSHIREELTTNELLKQDLGPFREERITWNSVSLILNNYGAKITAASTEQSVRGLRHINHRPDLIIIDDAENQDSVRTQESRDKLSHQVSGDIIPAGHTTTKLIVIGSVLHPDGLIRRLQKGIDDGKINGIYRMYPIVDESGRPLWPGKFPDMEAVEKEKARGIGDREWTIEYMLQPIIDEDQIIKAEHIHYYDREIKSTDLDYGYVATGVDLAISQAASADFTAMVSGVVCRDDDGWKLYILPYPVNERLKGPEIEERIVQKSLELGDGKPTGVYIENVAFQQAMIDIIEKRDIPVKGVSPGGVEKRARMNSISGMIKNGRVLFPKHGAERIINQLIWFGIEKHDDLSDALVILTLQVFEQEESGRIVIPRADKILTSTPEDDLKEADEEARLFQEACRSNDKTAWDKYNTFRAARLKKYYDKQTHDWFKRRGRGW